MQLQQTHESYIHAVAALAIAQAELQPGERERLERVKLTYGAGDRSGRVRGTTFFNLWQSPMEGGQFIELIDICALAQESIVQIIGTTLHELGHALAGPKAGHGPDWKAACERLGLRRVKAAGTHYCASMFRPDLRDAFVRLPRPADGAPGAYNGGALPWSRPGVSAGRACGAGTGTRGGKSRGKGSGSRMRKYVCQCAEHDGKPGPYIVRAATNSLAAVCAKCTRPFVQAD